MATVEELNRTRCNIAAARERSWVEHYMRYPDMQGPYRLKADLRLAEVRLAQMRWDNHQAAKQSDPQPWDEKSLENQIKCIDAMRLVCNVSVKEITQ